MSDIVRVQPPELRDTRAAGFSQVVKTNRDTLVLVAGQVAWDRDGRIVGAGDLVAQTHQVMKNLGAALRAAGATFDDVIKITVFVVNYKPSDRARILEVRQQYLRPGHEPASTLIGVQSLVTEDCLIEIEAIAAVATPVPG